MGSDIETVHLADHCVINCKTDTTKIFIVKLAIKENARRLLLLILKLKPWCTNRVVVLLAEG